MLNDALSFLLDEAQETECESPGCGHSHQDQLQHFEEHLTHLDISAKFSILSELLCVRPPEPPLPEQVLQQLDHIFAAQKSHRVLVKAGSLTPLAISKNRVRISLWRGDITTLTDVSAITNAANEKMLGCFQPTHRCIDNIIHARAGPRLRLDCDKLMKTRGEDLYPGEAIVTQGHNIPSPYIIHTVGPQLARGAAPTEEEENQLSRCYKSILEALKSLPSTEEGTRSVALCCISTGLFAFPAEQAAEIATQTVFQWLEKHPGSRITDIIFNTFTEADTEIYQNLLSSLPEGWSSYSENPGPISVQSDSIELARQWLSSAEAILVTAGAGLSASDGLDYTSPTLFKREFPGFLKYGLRTLYSVFGFSGWPSEQDRWGYYFTHLNMVKNWPASPMYQTLLAFLRGFGDNAHVRTSNADGLFLANGWSTSQLSTPQGSYSVLQCMQNCRSDAVVESWPLVKDALPSLEKVTQRLSDPEKIPLCRFCGGKMFICVRASNKFNEEPFKEGEQAWMEFKRRVLRQGKNLVILELGVGMNTPGVLRWPNENLVSRGGGKVKLIRAGLGQEVAVPCDLEQEGLVTSIEGDLKTILGEILT